MTDGQCVLALRERISNLCILFTLSMGMRDELTEQQIVELAAASVPTLSPCRAIASLLTDDEAGLRSPDGSTLTWPELTAQLTELDGADGPVTGTGCPWARAYAFRAVGGPLGHLLVVAQAEPSHDELLMLRMLAQQTSRALTSAALHRQERETGDELRTLNAKLAEVNDRLAATVVDLEWCRKVHETLGTVAASGGGEAGITAAVHQLTGLPVAAEDRFGNLRAWAGPGRPEPYPRPPAWHGAEVLAAARRSPRPIRDRDRLIAVAQPRDEVLGVLALVDPERRAGEHELLALRYGAVVLTTELAHLQSLAETELRLRRDLVDDLLTGIDDGSALSRSRALDHDLRTPHRVLVVRCPGAPPEAVLVRAVEHALTRVLDTKVLVARRPDGVVLITPWTDERNHQRRWGQLHRAVADSLRASGGAIGVGGVCNAPSEVPRSYAEAKRALRVRLGSSVPSGVTVFEDLGLDRLLTVGDDDVELRQFVRKWLGPLLDYDSTSRSDLVTTLWQYFECGGNYDAAARALLIHRSTLRYRLRRIREISGQDLNAVDSRLNLHVATRAWQLLRGSS